MSVFILTFKVKLDSNARGGGNSIAAAYATHLLLLALITGLTAATSALARDRRGLLHFTRLGTAL